MKNILILSFGLLIATSGCMRPGMMAGGRGSMMGGMGNPMGNPMMGGGMGNPMMGMPGVTPGALPVGARGRVMAHGGSMYYGTGYTNPEAVFMATARRADLAAAAAVIPSTPMPPSPCADGSCPTTTVETPTMVDTEARARLDVLEDNLVLRATD